jgi:hypothetical protein
VEQEEKLTNIDETMERMDGTLVRVGKHLKNFAKTMMSDKLIICLIFLILAGSIFVLVFYFITKDDPVAQENKKTNSEDTIQRFLR